mgnify:CR=1 FL=1
MSVAEILAKKKAALALKNKEEGQAFLAANAEKEGVVTLPSGLQYEVLQTGTGASPRSAIRWCAITTAKIWQVRCLTAQSSAANPPHFA